MFIWFIFLCLLIVTIRTNTFGMRNSMIHILSKLQGHQVSIYRNNSTMCKYILTFNTKGDYLEKHFACPMWFPIYSVESVDGEQWKRMHKWTNEILKMSRWKHHLEDADIELQDDLICTSDTIAKNVIRMMWYLLFHRPISQTYLSLLWNAGKIWRKRIAQKGGNSQNDIEYLNRCVTDINEWIKTTPYEQLYHNHYNRTEFISCFIQPFLISPQINICDIFAEMYPHIQPLFESSSSPYKDYYIYETIRLYHPFPLLERFDESKNIQYFIEMDNFKHKEKEFNPLNWENPFFRKENQWFLFGLGKRGCIGKHIAMNVMTILLTNIIKTKSLIEYKPQDFHEVSGRRNDTSFNIYHLSFLLYRITNVLFKVLKNSIYRFFSPKNEFYIN